MKTIMVVDDEPAAAALLKAMLEQTGRFRVVAVSSVAEAWQTFADTAPTIDLVVSDIRMPGMTGPAMAARMGAVRPNMPVLFISGLVDHFEVEQTLSPTKYAFLTKPFTPQALLKVVDEMLGGEG